jgi:TRAP-type uncharacterized transport system substrate-binding protein
MEKSKFDLIVDSMADDAEDSSRRSQEQYAVVGIFKAYEEAIREINEKLEPFRYHISVDRTYDWTVENIPTISVPVAVEG